MAPSRLTEAPRPEQVEYRPIADYPGYFVGSDGTVWSTRTRGNRHRVSPWHLLRPGRRKNWRIVSLCHATGHWSVAIHRIVLEAFVGPCPPGMECRHLNGDGADNRLENLTWGTHAENTTDRARHGHDRRGEAHAMARLTEKAVQQIRRLHASGKWTGVALAKRFGVCRSTNSFIVTGQTWKHIT